jgi:uncharacterized protein (TIGR02145 family)
METGNESSSSVETSSSSEQAHVHAWGEWTTTAPTCEAKGTKTRTCTGNNSHTETEEIAKLDWNDWTQTTAPTCEAAGVETKTCPGNASTPETRAIAQLAWNEWTVTTPATPTTVGLETRTCPNNASTAETRPIPMKCGGYNPVEKFCDERDEKTYKYVDIDGQIWMAENLNHVAAGSLCYDDDTGGDSEGNCEIYGRLYDWNTAMDGATSSDANPSGVQGVCPSGWHLPSDAEWQTLIDFAGGDATAGTKLKAASGWNAYAGIPAGTDEHGFSAMPGGFGRSGGSPGYVGEEGDWWSASEYNSNSAYGRGMGNYGNYVGHGNYDKGYLYSVRCVRN